MAIWKAYKWTAIFLIIQIAIFFVDHTTGKNAAVITLSNLREMLLLVPPIFIVMGLMDVWVPKETLIRYMGHGSGLMGLLIAFVLGTVAAGPLYVAFPMGLLLLKKGARLSNVIFFLGVWSSTKLPILLFEAVSLGFNFTLIHIGVSVPLYLLTAFYIERSVSPEMVADIVARAE
ncbi:permease [Propionispora hippei]|uniref:Predicted permease n=1 Tax=Propionispora hippei DSM 15287 TaxID=1123003 RepID=A0A1M6N163_9FIRM|nr:permease [Propionispora hippei]SHJ89467.1 Predicted permease [Propionispora hippei DSM 15287]